MWFPPPEHPLRRLFAGLTEHAFQATLGVADPPLVDYLSEMLARFIHTDALCPFQDGTGRRLSGVGDMLAEARALPPEGRTYREYHRHVGDFALFWSGLYPEALARLRSPTCKDALLDYCEQGKRAYRVASGFTDEPFAEESAVLRRLSDEFELCAFGLMQVRKEWEAMAAPTDGSRVLSYRLVG